ncbi:MAG: glycosyltransferase family 9 protein [Bacteroidales bacterium]
MNRIIISRTDNLGDVILTLPMAGILKQHYPGLKIIFLGKKYTKPIIDACVHIDEFLDWEELDKKLESGLRTETTNELKADAIIHVFPVKKIQKLAKIAGIPVRIGTSHRSYSWLYCNKLIHYSRKNSNLHEAQLNLKLLKPLGITREYTLTEIPGFYGLTRIPSLSNIFPPHPERFNLILHPKSKGSAREWGTDNYSSLIGLLPEDKFNIFVTGTKEEGEMMKDFLVKHQNRIHDLTGKLSLEEFLSFINSCDGLIAASTGPLHIAAALGKKAIGIYAPMRPIFPARWAPLGANASYLVLDKKCNDCRRTEDCTCIRAITPEDVADKILS